MRTTKAQQHVESIIELINPGSTHHEGPNPSSLVIKATVDDNAVDGLPLELTIAIVDPNIPEQGGPDEYLALTPLQRTMLDLTRVLNTIMPAMIGASRQLSTSQDLWQAAHNDPKSFVTILRQAAPQAALEALRKIPTSIELRATSDTEDDNRANYH